ncbi:hypothetical protein [Desulfosporosinus youngiae]|uniref:Uncharacterized protein n=1 Tax=Desulfosporosinus youngiae DSM 17734 TaxID=768710 RepID=H5XUI0_9FIRM|nr:hypothetical protein [Desulfosporosinus youngiae]EHQ88998.1 hypothetical protein DesyoDRAFT_1878 [Desulfosporosinus youngiae DSM 17734]
MLTRIDNMIAAKKIKSLFANIAGQLDLPEIDIQDWIQKLFPILLDFHSKYGNRQYVFILNKLSLPSEESQLLNPETLWNLISKRIECFNLDLNIMFSISGLNSSEIVDVCDYCYDNAIPALYVFGEEICLYNREGRCVAFYNFVHPEVTTRNRIGLNARSYRDYKLVIEEQGTKQLINKIDEIWIDRSKRILIANRQTEKILQNFLAKWLNDNIHDARVVSEVGKISGVDRTDIELTSISSGDHLIIEVKWMGINASGSSHDIRRLEEGIRQVCTYLEREPSALEGCVVCYDGRKESEKANTFTLNEPIARLDYRIVWLESKSGSEIGACI